MSLSSITLTNFLERHFSIAVLASLGLDNFRLGKVRLSVSNLAPQGQKERGKKKMQLLS